MVLDSGVLRVHRLLRRGPAPVRFSRVGSGGSHVESVRGTLAGRGVGIYIHIPYCRSTCLLCPYFRGVLRDRGELETYLEALLREVELYGRALEDLDLDVVELHVGGGTPSLVPPRFYRELRGKLSEFFNLRSGVGIEVNPEDFRSPQLVGEFYACGVDEVSIGVQSFDARVLRSIGRKHGPEDGARAVENSLRAGFRWVNVDVMFLTPSIRGYAELSLDEKLRAFRRDLEEAVELGAHQVTYYATVVPRGSPGYRGSALICVHIT
jgi:oxygen-independent coproporphyrinogen-3 oxidase